MTALELSVAKQFSRTPGSRYISEGEFSGELFRQRLLAPMVKEAMSAKTQLRVNLDGTAGYGTSFLEEAFGGLVREDGLDPQALRASLLITSTEEPYLADDIYSYIQDAGRSETDNE